MGQSHGKLGIDFKEAFEYEPRLAKMGLMQSNSLVGSSPVRNKVSNGSVVSLTDRLALYQTV